ncbi:MAG TPA: nuclear transport factor 2 family protein [Candidatus Krumholzibacteria bacterium]|nr:nuclear transport factor 2 family protein [Candidatus Krumholzibacteria bacterium]
MKRMYVCLVLAALSLMLVASVAFAISPQEREKLEAEVRAAEDAFAKTMADRDIKAFATFIADDAVFFGRERVTRGKQLTVDAWDDLFQAPAAPFSWKAESAYVLDSGDLAHSSGPVYSADGKQFGTFNSIWRRQADGTWKVVFDKGCEVCAPSNQ